MVAPTSPHAQQARHRRAWYSPTALWRSMLLRPRVYLAATTGIIALATLPDTLPHAIRAAIAWDIGGAVYLTLAVMIMRNCGADVIQTRAARQDDSGFVILALILLAIAASFTAIAGLIHEAKSATGSMKQAYLGLAGTTIAVSWLVTQVVFTLHYAHEHYAPEHIEQRNTGLVFPGDEHPNYWDFFYFATSIGATSQTSDTSIRSKEIRRLVTVHAIVSFFFNTIVLALTINLAASLAAT